MISTATVLIISPSIIAPSSFSVHLTSLTGNELKSLPPADNLTARTPAASRQHKGGLRALLAWSLWTMFYSTCSRTKGCRLARYYPPQIPSKANFADFPASCYKYRRYFQNNDKGKPSWCSLLIASIAHAVKAVKGESLPK